MTSKPLRGFNRHTEGASARRSKGIYTKAELKSEKEAKKTLSKSGLKTPTKSTSYAGGPKKAADAKVGPKKPTKGKNTKNTGTDKKTSGNGRGSGSGTSTKRPTVKKATGTTRGVVKAKSTGVKSSAGGPKRVTVSKTKKQERQQKRTQRKAKRAADARNEANKILKKTSGTGKKVTSRDQRKLKRLRGKYNRNTK